MFRAHKQGRIWAYGDEVRLGRRIKRALLRKLLPIPVTARHAEYSVISSVDDDPARPSPRLLSLSLEAIRHAQGISLDGVENNRERSIDQLCTWPGEHYKLLSGLVAVLQPKLVIEVGTGPGGGALCIKQALPLGGKLVTFDIIGWRAHPDNVLEERDFQDGRLVQHVADLSQPSVFSSYRSLFEEAEMIFVDAAKDGIMEQHLLDLFETVSFRVAPVVVFDDIRVWNMLKLWRAVKRPKLDLTSFGHWSGTGIIDWAKLCSTDS